MKQALGMLAVGIAVALTPRLAAAHCDTLDGPVAKAGRAALETGKANLALVWIQARDEAELLAALAQARKVRPLSADAKDLAERSFLETLVRLHRAGEGVAFTGIKPAGARLEPGIAAADEAIATGKLDALEKLVPAEHRPHVAERYRALKGLKAPPEDVRAGREWVAAYVRFIHLVEEASGQEAEGTAKAAHGH
jgi:hypothetical protein